MPTPPAKAPMRVMPGDPKYSTLRISQPELDHLRRELEATSEKTQSERREFMRWPFEKMVTVEMVQAGSLTASLTFVCRNISRGGISLLHRAFVYPGTRVGVTIPHPTQGEIHMSGVVRRCRHFKGCVHEIGVQFDDFCNVRELLGLDQADGCYLLERVDPDKLEGSALVIEDSVMDRLIIRQALSETKLTVTASDSGTAGFEEAAKGYDVILCSMDLPDVGGLQVLSMLREHNIHTPFVLITAENNEQIRDLVRAAHPDGFICRPVNREGLLSVLGEVLLLQGQDLGGGTMFSTLNASNSMIAHVPTYVDELKTYSQRVNDAIQADEFATCRRIALQIKGSAPTFGFEMLGKIAEAAATQLNASMSVEESAHQLKALVAACMRVRPSNVKPAAEQVAGGEASPEGKANKA